MIRARVPRNQEIIQNELTTKSRAEAAAPDQNAESSNEVYRSVAVSDSDYNLQKSGFQDRTRCPTAAAMHSRTTVKL